MSNDYAQLMEQFIGLQSYTARLEKKFEELATRGLTKREEFARSAMVGLLSADAECDWPITNLAKSAVEHADALLKALEVENE